MRFETSVDVDAPGDVLWLVLLTSVVHWALLGWIVLAGRKAPAPRDPLIVGP